MGYDMHWRKVDPSEEVAVAAARAVFDNAVNARNAIPQAERGIFRAGAQDLDDHGNWEGRTACYAKAQDGVSAALDDMPAQASYFRLNIFGMSRWREVMYELGMIYDDGPVPEWPEIESFGVTWDEVEQAESPEYYEDAEPLTPQKLEAATAYRAARDRVLAWHGSTDTPGIPAHKFGSNDGWIVLPAECDAALRIYMARREEIGPDAMDELIRDKTADPGYWGQWLAYLHGAISHDGFTVN